MVISTIGVTLGNKNRSLIATSDQRRANIAASERLFTKVLFA
jgi:hypothetical protein